MGFLVFFGLSLVIIFHELGHFLMSKIFGVAVEELGLGFPPRIWGKKIGKTFYSINWILWGGFLKINGLREETEVKDLPPKTSFTRQKFYKKAFIISGGVLANFLLGWALLSLVMFAGIPQSILVEAVKPDSVAYNSGIQKGDLILNFKNSDDFNAYLYSNRGKGAILSIKRNGEQKEIRVELPAERSKTGEFLGIYYSETGMQKTGIWESIIKSFDLSVQMIVFYFTGYLTLIGKIFTNWSFLNNLVGPIGLFAMGSTASKVGFVYFLQLLASLSINLMVFNFFPFPVLDGGWFLIILIEKIKGSPLSKKTEQILNSIGFLVLFSAFFLITIKDIVNLF
ncbi:MAG: site-2 protease family protein [Patescibacteria group bacterium]|nr:site-2 protease family protein [Patescibacteria group bacterium]